MIINKAKITTTIAAGAIIAGILLPNAAFASTVKIKGNGAGSSNTVNVASSSKNSVKQVSKTAVVNLVGVNQNTGGNKAKGNTGGDVTITSGNATSTVTNTTTTGGNILNSPCSECNTPVDDTLIISGNGKGSSNTINSFQSSSSCTTQVNKTLVVNGVLVNQNTGDNKANGNTGEGSVSLTSGDTTSDVTNDVTTVGNVINP